MCERVTLSNGWRSQSAQCLCATWRSGQRYVVFVLWGIPRSSRAADDPALDISREHHHSHLHHDSHAEAGREDDVVYTQGTTQERSIIPDQDRQDNYLHRRHQAERRVSDKKDAYEVSDAEKGNAVSPVQTGENSEGEDPRSHKLSGFYSRYRIFFHLAFWLLMTR